jgi:hypothetical protein
VSALRLDEEGMIELAKRFDLESETISVYQKDVQPAKRLSSCRVERAGQRGIRVSAGPS